MKSPNILTLFALALITAAPCLAAPATCQLSFDKATIKPADQKAATYGDDKKFTRAQLSAQWTLPAGFRAGYYAIEFEGVAPDAPAEWADDREPYFIETSVAGKRNDLVWSSEVDPKNRRLLNGLRHSLLETPLSVTLRRSDRPIRLEPNQVLRLESRSGGYNPNPMGEPTLILLDTVKTASMRTDSGVTNNIFDATPPRFEVKVQALGQTPFAGRVRATWLDALTGKTRTETHEVKSGAPLQLEWKPPFGVYTLTTELLDARGQMQFKQERHFSYAPLVDDTKLPADWPFAWHLRGEKYVPPVGFKWHRVFTSWKDMEPKKGEYDWKWMDSIYAQAKANNYKLLWVCNATPRWASTKPELGGDYQNLPPKNWDDLRDFLRAFYARYAPNGDTSVLGAIEVLNEPNAHPADKRFTFDEYAEMSKIVYQETKKVSPDIQVVGISESGGLHMWWVDGVLDAGAGAYMDIASAHGYETATALGPVSIGSKFRLLREALDKRGLERVKMWDTETGVGVWGRRGGAIQSDELMNARARQSSRFDPKNPGKVGPRWRSVDEWTGAANMVRSTAQKLDLGVEKVFYFKWNAGTYSWAGGRDADDNPIPYMVIPVQAVQSQLWSRYATMPIESPKIESPDPRMVVLAHRFEGPQGRLTVLYAYPRSGGIVITDEVAAKAAGLGVGEPVIDPMVSEFVAQLPSYDTPLFQVTLPDLRAGAVAMDILARGQQPLGAGDARVDVAQTPIYIIEPNDGGAVWPN